MTRIYLVRHGYVENPQQLFYGPEFPLSDRGAEQITELAHDMMQSGVRPAAILCSPFQRTRDTARVMTAGMALPEAQVDERLAEWNVGRWFDRPLADFYAATTYDQTVWHFDPTMETHVQMAARVIAVMTEVRQRHPDQDSVLISHREPIVSALLSLEGAPFARVHDVLCPVACAWEILFDGERFVSARQAFDRSADGHARAMG